MIKRTLQEIADFFGMALAMDKSGRWYLYEWKPRACKVSETWGVVSGGYCDVSRWMIDYTGYTGDWRDSLTLPENWTKEPPFKEGEIVINIELGFPSLWRKEYDLNADDYRRPTEAEWRVSEMLDVLIELQQCAQLPIGIIDRLNAVIKKAKGDSHGESD